ncbi:MAG: group II intron reverse transcriptase domain-containing protein [Candidatus Zambryskibacteria bacterium]|nr:group II intron reverse transcriptase domain-containing protein [Candidatus Zambryskibacteria bacterium]
MFEKIISLKNLFDAWAEFRKDKRGKKDVAEFELGLEDNIFKLHEDLKSGNYRHGGYFSFYISDPKRRHINKASVRDRLLHHAIIRVIEPMWDKKFIFDSWSSRKYKGTHAAVKRLHKIGLKISRNNSKTIWVLKLDIRKFFESVDHNKLLRILEEKTFDKELIILTKDIVESFNCGIPLGNLTSQIFANIFMNKFDQFVKHDLKVKGYIRYTDDFVLMHPDKNFLESCIPKIRDFCWQNLKLKIHPEKIILKTYASGIDYLGYICFPYHRVLRTKTKRRIFNRVTDKNFSSYNGLLHHCRSRDLKIKLLQKLNRNIPKNRHGKRFVVISRQQSA